MNIARFLLVCLFCLGICPAVAVAVTVDPTAQPAPASNPNLDLLTNGEVVAIAPAQGGGVIIGGSFTQVQGTPRANLAKIKGDGTLDTTWKADTDGEVIALLVLPSGAIYVGGSYSHIAGVSHFGLSKLAANGTLDTSWTPAPNGQIQTLATDGTHIYAGGDFSTMSTVAHKAVARLPATGTGVADSWNPGIVGSYVYAIAYDASSSSIYLGGSFTKVGTVSRSNLAKVGTDAAGTPDASWIFPATGTVTALAIEIQTTPPATTTSYLYVGGQFSTLGIYTRGGLGKINLTSGFVDTWKPSVNSRVWAIRPVGTRVFVAGDFSKVTDSGGTTALQGIAIFDNSAGDLSTNGQLGADDSARAIAYDPVNTVYYFGGNFRHINSFQNYGLVAVLSGLGFMPAPPVYAHGIVNAIITLADGSQFVGGRFILLGANPRTNLLKLTASGLLDSSVAPPIPDNDVLALCANGAGTVIYAGGSFHAMSMLSRFYLAEFSATTGALSTFDQGLDAQVNALAIDSSDALYAGGDFTKIGTLARGHVAKFSSAGNLSNWQVNLGGSVSALATDPAGYVYIGGFITDLDATSYSELIKVDSATGALQTSWKPTSNGGIYALSLSPDGLLYAGGNFSQIGGHDIASVAQINAALGIVSPNWHPFPFGQVVTALLADSAGRVFVGGNYYEVNTGNGTDMAYVSGVFKASETTGQIDLSWTPQSSYVKAIAIDFASPGGVLTIGGGFSSAGGVARNGLAAIPLPPADRIFANAFE